mmetsp:Transcript_22827/g.77667  ORF Transcript_22827/g.77667 Transcript_22827/m.77667 type:complete len:732 (+) Transcript_22827:177-2372(+)
MARLTGLLLCSLALGAVRAGIADEGNHPDGECPTDGAVPAQLTIKQIQQERPTDAYCGTSARDGEYVQVSGVVTALGANKDGGDKADFFWVQSSAELFSGIEVYYPFHVELIKRSDEVSVVGIVDEYLGLTTIKACQITVVSSNNALPAPLEIASSVFHGGVCTAANEGYEGLLVKLTGPSGVHAVACQDGSRNPSDCSAGIQPDDEPSWDKYRQTWFTTDGGSSMIEVDNHMYSLFSTYKTLPGTTFGSITGVMSFYNGADGTGPAWEIAVRDKSDVEGGVLIDTTQFAQAKLWYIQQLNYRYGNSLLSASPYKVGRDVVVKSGDGGVGNWDHGSCPNSTIQAWSYLQSEVEHSLTHSMCPCYPSEHLVDLLSLAGDYVEVTGRVVYATSPTMSFYLEDTDCSKPNRGMFVYRGSSTTLASGDMVTVRARPYQYYGNDQLTDPISITVLEKDTTTCPPHILESLEAFHIDADVSDDTGHGYKLKKDVATPGAVANERTATFCKNCAEVECAEKFEGSFVTIDYVTVVGFTKDWYWAFGGLDQAENNDEAWEERVVGLDGQEVTVKPRGPYQNHWCTGVAGGCQFIVEDREGYQMLVDNMHEGVQKFFRGEVSGYDGVKIQVGDTFSSITCLVSQSRGDYPLGRGGHYECNPVEGGMVGWNEKWPSKSKDGLEPGAIGGIVAGVVVLVGVASYVLYKPLLERRATDNALRNMQVEANPAAIRAPGDVQLLA